eukprot:1355789-Pyramimonas_sp.AAC.1
MPQPHHSSAGLLHIDVLSRPAPAPRRYQLEALRVEPGGGQRRRQRAHLTEALGVGILRVGWAPPQTARARPVRSVGGRALLRLALQPLAEGRGRGGASVRLGGAATGLHLVIQLRLLCFLVAAHLSDISGRSQTNAGASE